MSIKEPISQPPVSEVSLEKHEEDPFATDSFDADSTLITNIQEHMRREGSQDACLVVINGQDLGKRHALGQTSLMVGRSSKSDIRIDEDSISRHHVLLVNSGLEVSIRDLGSTNGTYVNGRKVLDRVLQDGDQIRVGRTIFKFLTGSNIENAYHEEIYRLTTMDALTRAFNKRYLDESLTRETSRAIRYQRPLSLAIFDLDFFKRVNDTYGHLTGDFVLQHAAERVRKFTQHDDVFARYGGEEFVILFPETKKHKAVQCVERIREAIAAAPFSSSKSADVPVTISAGVASLREILASHPNGEASDPEFVRMLMKLADDRLYRAKRTGRNRVVS